MFMFKYKRDQIISEVSTFSFHYELVMNFSWNPKDSHTRYELYIAWWNWTLIDKTTFILFKERSLYTF